MSEKIITQNSFTGGEISPRLYSRFNTGEFEKGLETATNAILTAHGPLKRRNGSKFIAEVKDSSAACKLIRYQFSQTLSYILELGHQYIRFYKDSSQVLESDITITGITAADPGVVTTDGAHGLSDGAYVYITDVVGMTEVNKGTVPYKVANKTSTTFELTDVDDVNVDTSGYTAYSSAGRVNKIYELASPYTTAQIDEVQYIQNGASLYIVHKDVAPRVLTRTSDTNWTLSTVEFLPPPTYEGGYDYNLAIKPLATTGLDKNVVVGAVNINDGSTHKWTASGSGTNEYYIDLFAGGDPSIGTPLAVVEDVTLMTEGTAGSLSAGEYDYGDNDSLGYSTIYVRLSDGTDPDSKASGYMVYSESDVLLDGDEGRQIKNLTTGETGRASITDVTNGALAVTDIVEDFSYTDIIAAGDSKLDLSPVVDLEFDAVQAGAIVNIRSEYTAGSLGPRTAITAVTKAATGVVTAAGHELVDGDEIQIQDIEGMTQINDREFTVDGVSGNDFDLKGEETTGYSTYSSGGIVRQILSDKAKAAFRSADVGKYILANGGVMEIVAVNSATNVDALIHKSLNTSEYTGNWSLETPTWTSTRGYPRAVGVYEQRLVFGGTDAQPQSVWMSETGIFDGFGSGPDDDDSIDVALSSNEVNTVSWIAASRDLVLGTLGGEVTLNSGSSAAIAPSAIDQQPRTYYGSKIQQIIPVKEEILFIQKSGYKIRSFRYDFNLDGYTGEDLTFLAEHITDGGIAEMAYAQEPDTILYAVLDTGEMLAGVYDRPKKVIGWGRFTTDGYYENVQTLGTSAQDQVWVVVKRTINGSTKRFIELFDSGNGEDDTDSFSDSSLTLSTPLAISGITAADPAVVTTSSAHGLSNGATVVLKDIVDPLAADLTSTKTNMSDLNQGVYTVANKTSTTFELSGVDTSQYNAYGSGGNAWLKYTVLSGLDHLEGKTVQIKVDGATHANKTISSGSVTLDTSGGEIIVGLPYTTTIKTLPYAFDIGRGPMQGQRVKINSPIIQVYKSARPTLNGEYLPARSAADKMDQKVPLYSGFLEYGNLSWDATAAITFTMTDPLPLQLLGISIAVSAGVK